MTQKKISVTTNPESCADMFNNTRWANDFTWKQLIILGKYFEPFSISHGGILFNEGDIGGTMSILTKGKIIIQKDGKKLTTLQSGYSFGEMSLIDNQRRSASAIAIEDSEFISINKEGLKKLSQDHPAVALMLVLKITQLLSQRLRQTSGQLSEFID